MALTILFTDHFYDSLGRILSFFDERNGSSNYSKKLTRLFCKRIMLLSEQPYIGSLTDAEDVRLLFVDEYAIEYAITKSEVMILDIFSCQTNPTRRLFKKL